MPISPSSSAQAAREAVARRLRELRRGFGLTVVELADRCNWHHSKTSRIENAHTAPSAKDIRAWCAACGADNQAEDLITQSVNAESMYTEWRHEVRRGLKALQENWTQFFHDTRLFRVYSSTLVPGLLQTEGYAEALLSGIADFRDIPNDAAEAAAARVERSRVIHEPGHRFVLLMEEVVLYYRIGDTEAMAAQLGYLLTAGALPQVSLGVIPFTAERSMWPNETFHVYDDTMASVELATAQVNIAQPSEVAVYVKTFQSLQQLAVYGAEARALIVKAIEALGSES